MYCHAEQGTHRSISPTKPQITKPTVIQSEEQRSEVSHEQNLNHEIICHAERSEASQQ